ncbi:MAG: nitrous oxide reductase accessory protein NosL [Deltaproteobacteria bacterium]|nr:nitrous oxide reductase accessory protein NosL [Deltaproteobacteria bacterium]
MIKKISLISSFIILTICFYTTVFTAETRCNVCSMNISQNSRQHFVVQEESLGKEPFHVCSVICLRKLKQFNSKLSNIEVALFNDPLKFIKSEKAFFLVKSEKIKADAGPMAMPPIAAAFATKKEADTAQKKYGDGTVVLGFENALQSLGK